MSYSLSSLFFSFFRIGLFTFGGGLAMLPLLEKEMIKYRLSQDEVWDFFSLGQTFPGVIAINCATLVGYHVASFWGAFWATIGVIAPSFIIIIAITLWFGSYLSNDLVQSSFSGIRVAASVLIFSSAFSLIFRSTFFIDDKGSITINKVSGLLFVITLGLLSIKVNPFFIIVISILSTILVYLYKRKNNK